MGVAGADLQLMVNALATRRGGQLIFEDVSFEARGGDILLLTGPNGVGKTTLLRTLAGLLKPSAGTVTYNVPSSDDAPDRVHLHFLSPRDGLKDAMTVRDNLTFWQRFLSLDNQEPDQRERKQNSALNTLNLQNLADVPAGYLSTGQRRRASLARLLVVDRPIWLLDEPTLGLDVSAREVLRSMLLDHVAEGGVALVATHANLGVENARELRLGVEEMA